MAEKEFCPNCGRESPEHYEGCPGSSGDYDQVPMTEARVREIVREEMDRPVGKA